MEELNNINSLSDEINHKIPNYKDYYDYYDDSDY